jgi:hypothetical protein
MCSRYEEAMKSGSSCSPYPLFGHAVDTGGNKHSSTQHRDACRQRLLITSNQQASHCDYQSTSINVNFFGLEFFKRHRITLLLNTKTSLIPSFFEERLVWIPFFLFDGVLLFDEKS